MVSQSVVMMVAVSGGFALLAVLAAAWWFATGQHRTRAQGVWLPFEDEDLPADAPGRGD